jgi:protein TonB
MVPQKVTVVKMDASKFQAPTEIPKEIPPPMEDVPEYSSVAAGVGGVPGGVPGGVVGGVPGGVTGGVLGGVPKSAAPPPPPPPSRRKDPVKVGGNVQASKLIHRVEPDYPELAKRARVQGIVLLKVTVDESGNVANIELVRGHPLLTQAAIDAVRQWKYSPTILNNEPVPVIATVTVNFVLR